MRKILFYPLMFLIFILLLVEVPSRELARSWRNSYILNRYKDAFKRFFKELRLGP